MHIRFSDVRWCLHWCPAVLHLSLIHILPVTVGIRTIKEYIPREAIYTEQEAKQRAEQELQLFFEKIKIKGLQIIENGVKIEVNGQVCTAKGSLLVEEEAVRTQKPVIEIQEENDQHLEEEREQT